MTPLLYLALPVKKFQSKIRLSFFFENFFFPFTETSVTLTPPRSCTRTGNSQKLRFFERSQKIFRGKPKF
jgi:hypothetical protein